MSLLNYLTARKKRQQDCKNRQNKIQTLRNTSTTTTKSKRRSIPFPNPLHTLRLLFEKDVGLLLLYNSLIYTAFYDVMASLPYLLSTRFRYNSLQIGLCFVPFGVGTFIAPLLVGKIMDLNYARVARKTGMIIEKGRTDDLSTFPVEKARIGVAAPMLGIGIATLLVYGWCVEYAAHLPLLLVLHFILGFFLTGAFNGLSVMLIDLYPTAPATATAANNLVRCLMGAAGTAIVIVMIEKMTWGWCFTFLAAVLMMGSSLLWVLCRWGPKWREERKRRIGSKA
jgi:MFS family permease